MLRNSFDTLSSNTTLFLQVTTMATTGNMSLTRQMGAVMLQEARALSNYATDHNLGPFSLLQDYFTGVHHCPAAALSTVLLLCAVPTPLILSGLSSWDQCSSYLFVLTTFSSPGPISSDK